MEKLYAQRQRVQDTLEEKLVATACESGNFEVQCSSVLDTISDVVEKVDKRARKPWITQKMISKIDERKKLKNVNTEENRMNYGMLRTKLKRATENAKK